MVAASSGSRSSAEPRYVVRYGSVREQIRPADLLLLYGQAFHSRLIATVGRGPYSHAEKAVWCNGVLLSVGMTFFGGRAVTLSSQVRRYPGRIDWYAANPDNRWPEYDRDQAAVLMLRLTGTPYAFGGLLLSALRHTSLVRLLAAMRVPGFRALCRPVPDKAILAGRRPAVCSEACAIADRLGGGVDAVPQLTDRWTEPPDLARSPFYEYRGSLVPV